MGRRHGGPKARLSDVIAIAHRVHGIRAHAVEFQILGQKLTIDPERVPGERAGPERHDVHALDEIAQSLIVSLPRRGVRE